MFKHANRHNPVELLREFAVILQTKPNVVGYACFLRPFIGQFVLLCRQRNPGDVGAGNIRDVKAQATPARADIENVQVLSVEQKFRCQVPFFGQLCAFETFFRIGEVCAGILAVPVQEKRIEIG
jgi:hypothetical protein